MFIGVRNFVRSLVSRLQNVVGKIMVIIMIVIIFMLAFYWNTGFEDIQVKSIPTEGGRVVYIIVNAEFFLALTTIILFYLGYRAFTGRERPEIFRSLAIENRNEIIAKYIFSIVLGVIGAWVIYTEFSREGIWSYHTPFLVRISRQATINETSIPVSWVLSIIALLLLLNWYVILKVRFGYKKSERDVEIGTRKHLSNSEKRD